MKWNNASDCDVESDEDNDDSDDDNDQKEDTEPVAKDLEIEDEMVSAIVQEVSQDDPIEVEKDLQSIDIKVILIQRLLKNLENLKNLLLQ